MTSHLDKDRDAVERPADIAFGTLIVELRSHLEQKVFGSDSDDSFQVAIVRRDLVQIELDELPAGDRLVIELDLKVRSRGREKVDPAAHVEIG